MQLIILFLWCLLLIKLTLSQLQFIEIIDEENVDPDSTSKFDVQLGGVYYPGDNNTAAQNSILTAIQSLHGISYDSLSLLSDPSDTNDIFKYASFQLQYDDLDIGEILLQYSDIDSFNTDLQSTDSSIKVLGNMIFCEHAEEERCHQENKIGPQTHHLISHAPIAMNTDFNLENIVKIKNETSDTITPYIKIYALINTMWRLHESITTQQFIQENIFSNADNGEYYDTELAVHIRHETELRKRAYGIYIAEYTDLTNLHADTGKPQEFNITFNDYVFSGILYTKSIKPNINRSSLQMKVMH